jgi:hypothetical protein
MSGAGQRSREPFRRTRVNLPALARTGNKPASPAPRPRGLSAALHHDGGGASTASPAVTDARRADICAVCAHMIGRWTALHGHEPSGPIRAAGDGRPGFIAAVVHSMASRRCNGGITPDLGGPVSQTPRTATGGLLDREVIADQSGGDTVSNVKRSATVAEVTRHGRGIPREWTLSASSVRAPRIVRGAAVRPPETGTVVGSRRDSQAG